MALLRKLISRLALLPCSGFDEESNRVRELKLSVVQSLASWCGSCCCFCHHAF